MLFSFSYKNLNFLKILLAFLCLTKIFLANAANSESSKTKELLELIENDQINFEKLSNIDYFSRNLIAHGPLTPTSAIFLGSYEFNSEPIKIFNVTKANEATFDVTPIDALIFANITRKST
jgi:hypothetical protein